MRLSVYWALSPTHTDLHNETFAIHPPLLTFHHMALHMGCSLQALVPYKFSEQNLV